MAYFARKSFVFEHSEPGNFYNKPLVETIKTIDGRYIAVEHNQHWNYWGEEGEDVVPEFHLDTIDIQY